MAIALIVSQLVILFVLVFHTRQFPLLFRLFLGLVATWPVLNLYVTIDLPSGIPDIHYARAYAGMLIVTTILIAVVERRYRPSAQAEKRLMRRKMGSAAHSPVAASGPHQGVTPHGSSAESYQGSLTGIPVIVTIYLVLLAVSVIGSVLAGGAASTAVATFLDTSVLPLAAYFFTRKYVTSRQRLTWLLGAIAIAAIFVCMTGIYEHVLDLADSPYPIPPINENGDTRWLGVPGGRAAGVLANPAIYGGMMGMGMLCVLVFFVHSRNWWQRIAFGSMTLMLGYGVFISYTRSAWLAAAIALLFAQFFLKGLWRWMAPVFIVGTFAGILAWSALEHSELVRDRVLDKENVTGRVERIAWSWEQFLEHPILGQGPGALDASMIGLFPENFDTSHNTYMTMLVDNGIVRFGLFSVIVLGWFVKAGQALKSGPRNEFEYCVVAVMLGFLMIWLLSGMSIELNRFPYFAAMFWVAGAIIERLHAHAERSQFIGAKWRKLFTHSLHSRMSPQYGGSNAQLHHENS